jgi:putative nucleotidyltransferase with HDIG domain
MSAPGTANPITAKIRERVGRIETMPSIPAVFVPLLKLLQLPAEQVRLDEVVQLISYDNAMAAQCLRVASSPLFGLARSPESIKGAVLALGMRRVETILLTCCLGQAFPLKNWALDAVLYWRHSLGCAMVCRKFAEKLSSVDGDKAYMGGLLHDIGVLVNCLSFPTEFAAAVAYGIREQVPLHEAENSTMGFTHCETGRALAEQWNLGEAMTQVIAHHHAIDSSEKEHSLVALVHLCDLLCRMRGLGYGYYERQKIDLTHDSAWEVLLKEQNELAGVDLVRFTFELDDSIADIYEMVTTIFAAGTVRS